MGLLIHDLKTEDWDKISTDYAGWTVVSETGPIHPCVGCFCCWHKTPGQCVIKDGYDNMGQLVHSADEVVVISRYTWGGCSGFIKNVLDRSLGYVLPHFELVGGESHHKKRYDEDKPFTFIFYGHGLTEEEKDSARRYVKAVCTNFRSHVKDVIFRENGGPERPAAERSIKCIPGRTIFLNGSMRCANGNSAKFARSLAPMLKSGPEIVNLKDWLGDMSGLIRLLEEAETIVLCVPLYVDGLPAQVIRLMEKFSEEYRGISARIYVLANMGLYESRQLVNLFEAVRQWCLKTGLEYCGGLGISAGEMLGTLIDQVPVDKGPNRNVGEGMAKLAEAINSGAKTEVILAEPHRFPRRLYMTIANVNWSSLAKKNGISPKDLYRRLEKRTEP